MALLLVLALAPFTLVPAVANDGQPHVASGFTPVKMAEQAACQNAYTGGVLSEYLTRNDCIRYYFTVTNTGTAAVVTGDFYEEGSDTPFTTMATTNQAADTWRFVFRPGLDWPAGRTRVVVKVGDEVAGQGFLNVNVLTAGVGENPKADGTPHAPGEPVAIKGNISEIMTVGIDDVRTGVAADFSVLVRTADGAVRGPYGPFTATSSGDFTAELPAAATAGLAAGPESDFKLQVALDIIDAVYEDLPVTGQWANKLAGSGSVTLISPAQSLIVEATYTSPTGWVRPDETFPLRVAVKNLMPLGATNAVVTIPAPASLTFVAATPIEGGSTTSVTPGSLTWTLPNIDGLTGDVGTVRTLVVQAKAASFDQDPEVAWKDLSSTASLTYDGYAGAALTSTTHGPKVIPPGVEFETARYGDKPFPVVPVDFTDRSHSATHTGADLDRVINSRDMRGSTWNLFQEMSYGQLFPIGSVPASDIATADFSSYEPGFTFTQPTFVGGTCRGTTRSMTPQLWETPLYPERINDGWYQLPGDTEYYGGDFPAFTLGVGSSIDQACGPTAKGVYDAAQIADPEIDYSDFDGDKDGVVDFFMMVFVGIGGNGGSQLSVPPYDNIWPHSSSLEFSYKDAATGLRGYISDDQLRDHYNRNQCWLDDTYSKRDSCLADGGAGDDSLPVYVRVGPYNVNPEDAIEKASVIGHEYGHHLGLPDFYSSYASYGTQNLMAADHSQHMTVFSKQELGWVVPDRLEPARSLAIADWAEIKNDTGEVHWQTPDGTPYTLSAANGDQNIHNGQAYKVSLPKKLVLDPEKVASQASASHVWWSGRGNDFGCSPTGGHNLDLYLPELADVAAGTPVTVSFKSSWDIEWDWDYGFVLTTTDGEDYVSSASQNGYTTPSAYNPNGAGCLDELDNGLTGQSGAYSQGEPLVTAARNPAEPDYGTGSPFIDDSYDISNLAGESGATVRFSYFTDPAFDRPGWFIDDVLVMAGDEVIYDSDLEWDNHGVSEHGRWFQGGCDADGFDVSAICTAGWSRINTSAGSEADHAYYLELRDRSGFDYDGFGQSDRGEVDWAPGVFIEYTDEVRGYGNNGSPQPPNQQYLDSQPNPGLDCSGEGGVSDPVGASGILLGFDNCTDNSFTPQEGDALFEDDPNDDNGPWLDNFSGVDTEFWEFGYDCLRLEVLTMAGDTGNTGDLPSDLTAGAEITTGPGCIPATFSGPADQAPPAPASGVKANAQTKSQTVAVGETVTFDGSSSTNDGGTADDLTYAWDFGDGSTGTGQSVSHAYAAAGTYTVTLTVTNAAGDTDSDTLTMTVTASGSGGQPLPTTGGGAALAGLLLLGGAVGGRLRRRG